MPRTSVATCAAAAVLPVPGSPESRIRTPGISRSRCENRKLSWGSETKSSRWKRFTGALSWRLIGAHTCGARPAAIASAIAEKAVASIFASSPLMRARRFIRCRVESVVGPSIMRPTASRLVLARSLLASHRSTRRSAAASLSRPAARARMLATAATRSRRSGPKAVTKAARRGRRQHDVAGDRHDHGDRNVGQKLQCSRAATGRLPSGCGPAARLVVLVERVSVVASPPPGGRTADR